MFQDDFQELARGGFVSTPRYGLVLMSTKLIPWVPHVIRVTKWMHINSKLWKGRYQQGVKANKQNLIPNRKTGPGKRSSCEWSTLIIFISNDWIRFFYLHEQCLINLIALAAEVVSNRLRNFLPKTAGITDNGTKAFFGQWRVHYQLSVTARYRSFFVLSFWREAGQRFTTRLERSLIVQLV